MGPPFASQSAPRLGPLAFLLGLLLWEQIDHFTKKGEVYEGVLNHSNRHAIDTDKMQMVL